MRFFNRADDIAVKQPPLLFGETQMQIKEIIRQLDGDFLSYWGANNASIAGNDSIAIGEIINRAGVNSNKLYLFVKSSGGSGESSLRTINLLRSYYEQVVALVPLSCASAATMLALGADEIHMGALSYLTAVDTSIIHDLSPVDSNGDLVSVSQNELDRVIRLWNKEGRDNDANSYKSLYKYIHPLVFGAVDRASSLSIRLTSDILSFHMDDQEKIDRISHHLNAEYPSHEYPITSKEAKSIGLPVVDMDQELYSNLMQLNHLYSEMTQRCYTDYSEYKYHNNQIYTIIESLDYQIHYQTDKDFVWRKDDQQWITTNDQSTWKIIDRGTKRNFFIR
ncbi:MAG: hypothetical protein R2824_00990 [Saprospiraceae bacterium]